MSSTREIKVIVAAQARDGREPETRDGVFAQMDSEMACEQVELEEAIAFLQIQVRDLQARRSLLGDAQRRIGFAEGINAEGEDS